MPPSSPEQRRSWRQVVRRIRMLVEAIVLILALIVALAGCGQGGGPAPPRGDVAIVIAHHDGELAPHLSPADSERLTALASDPDRDDATAFVISAGRSQVETIDLEPRRPNGAVERGPRHDVLVQERLAALDAAIRRAAEQSVNTDLLGALAVAGRSGATEIIMLTAGLSTFDPLDMRVAGWDGDPVAVAHDLRNRGVLPDLSGRHVVISGIGRTAGEQPPLDVHVHGLLRERWLQICTAMGARCAVDDLLRPALSPVSDLHVPIVEVPRTITTSTFEGSTTVEVPSAVLFAPDTCALLDPAAANAALLPLVDLLDTGQHAVAVSGRTAPVGGDGIALSTCRAQAAADLLLTLAPGTVFAEIRGDGSLLDPPSASQGPDGRIDPARLAALRRVVFTLIPRETR
jgi:hypothetical protein